MARGCLGLLFRRCLLLEATAQVTSWQVTGISWQKLRVRLLEASAKLKKHSAYLAQQKGPPLRTELESLLFRVGLACLGLV